MGKLSRNYIYNLIYQLFVFITPILTAPYLARVLGAKNLGIYSFVYSVASIVNTITLLGTHTYGYRQIAYVRDNRKEMNQVFWEVFTLRLFLGIFGTIIFLVYSYNSDYCVEFILYYPWLFASFIDCSFLFVGIEEMKIPVLRNMVVKLLSVIGVFLIVRNTTDLEKYIVVMSCSNVIGVLCMYPSICRYIQTPKINFKKYIFHIKGSFNLFLPQAASFIYLQIDKIMLEGMLKDTTQISFYDQADKLVQVPLTVISVLSSVIMPRMANEFKKGNFNNVKYYLTKSFQFSMFLAIPMTCGLIMIAPGFIPWYLGNEFIPVISAMIILAPLIISTSLGCVTGTQYFTAINNVKILLIANVSAFVINILCNSILIPFIGYNGAAIATILASVISAAVQLFYLNKTVPIGEIFKKAKNYLLSSIVMMLVLLIVNTFLKIWCNPIITVILVLIGVFTYFCMCYILKDEMFLQFIEKLYRKRGK